MHGAIRKALRALLSIAVATSLMAPVNVAPALAADDEAAGEQLQEDAADGQGADVQDEQQEGDASDQDAQGGDQQSQDGADEGESQDVGDVADGGARERQEGTPEPSAEASVSAAPSDGSDDADEEEGDRTADVESAADWQAMADALAFTGQWAHDLLLMAESQTGYNESARNFIYEDGDQGKKQGYTRYGDWYGNGDGALYGEWCAMFVSFCLHYAGVQNSYYDANCASWVARIQAADAEDEAVAEQAGEKFAAADHRYQSAEDYIPQAGDIVFFDKGTGTACHVGIVKCLNYDSEHGVQPIGFTAIEGNNGPVGYHAYALGGDGEVLGFMRLPENPDYRTVHCGETPLCVTAEIPQDVTFAARTVEFADVAEDPEATVASEADGAAEDAPASASVGAAADAASKAASDETTVVADSENAARTLTVPAGWKLVSLVEVNSTTEDEAWNPSKPAIASFVRTGTLRARAAAIVAEDGTMEIIDRENVSPTVSFEYRGAGTYALLAKKDAGIVEQVRTANEVKSALIVEDEGSLENLTANTVRATRARALSLTERIEAAKPPSRTFETQFAKQLHRDSKLK